MKKFPIAVQVYSVRHLAAADFVGTMRALKAMGYDGVELAGTYGMTAVEIKQILDEVGLVLVGAHINVELMEEDAVLADYAAAGLKCATIPWFHKPDTIEMLVEHIDRIRHLSERCRAYGLQLSYHNHDFEMEEVPGTGRRVLEAYYEEIGPDRLQTQLDLCWVRVGGEDPAAYLKKFAGRAPTVHFKDYVGDKAEKMYALIDCDDEAAAQPATAFEFRPVGYGCQDVPALLQAAEEAGCQWIIVEQDEPSMGLSRLECVEKSVQYLKSLM